MTHIHFAQALPVPVPALNRHHDVRILPPGAEPDQFTQRPRFAGADQGTKSELIYQPAAYDSFVSSFYAELFQDQTWEYAHLPQAQFQRDFVEDIEGQIARVAKATVGHIEESIRTAANSRGVEDLDLDRAKQALATELVSQIISMFLVFYTIYLADDMDVANEHARCYILTMEHLERPDASVTEKTVAARVRKILKQE
jgi:hypothetical protein